LPVSVSLIGLQQ